MITPPTATNQARDLALLADIPQARDLVAEISMRLETLAQSPDVSPNTAREAVALGVLVCKVRQLAL